MLEKVSLFHALIIFACCFSHGFLWCIGLAVSGHQALSCVGTAVSRNQDNGSKDATCRTPEVGDIVEYPLRDVEIAELCDGRMKVRKSCIELYCL